MVHHLPQSLSLSLFPILSCSWVLALSCSVEVGHWVDSPEHDVISKVTEWMSEKWKGQKMRGTGMSGKGKHEKSGKNWAIKNKSGQRHVILLNTWCGDNWVYNWDWNQKCDAFLFNFICVYTVSIFRKKRAKYLLCLLITNFPCCVLMN